MQKDTTQIRTPTDAHERNTTNNAVAYLHARGKRLDFLIEHRRIFLECFGAVEVPLKRLHVDRLELFDERCGIGGVY